MHLAIAECGCEAGDELELPAWVSTSSVMAEVEFGARLTLCLTHMAREGSKIDNEPALMWTSPYDYTVSWLEISDSWVSDGEDVEDALVRRAREGIESELADVSREEFEIELTQCLRKAARGIFDRRGLRPDDDTRAKKETLRWLCERYGA